MNGGSILVVDDNESNLRLMEALLETEGYVVKTALETQEAMQVLETFEPKLILMDLQLPGMDGLEFTRLLKQDPARRHISIVALTAYAMKGDEEKAIAAGCDGYLTKPIDTRSLPESIAAYMNNSHDFEGAPAGKRTVNET
jgi:CheY-like chemotaxis protein